MATTPSDLGSATLAAAARWAGGGGLWERGMVGQSVGPSVCPSVDVSKLRQEQPTQILRLQQMRRMRQPLCGRAKYRPPHTSSFRPPAHFRARLAASAQARSILRNSRPPWRARTQAHKGEVPGYRLLRELSPAFLMVCARGCQRDAVGKGPLSCLSRVPSHG